MLCRWLDWLFLLTALVSFALLPCCKKRSTARGKSSWKRKLVKAAQGANRLVVATDDSTDDSNPVERKLEIKGEKQVRDFLAAVDIDDKRSGFMDGCLGDASITLYRDSKQLVSLSYHHGISLRWSSDAWPGDALLTADSQEALPKWFAKRGFTILLSRIHEREHEAELEERSLDEFLVAFPEKHRRYFTEGSVGIWGREASNDEVGKALAKEFSDPVRLAVSACRALGDVRTSWSGHDSHEDIAIAAARTVSGSNFLGALSHLKNDLRGMLGAARLFFGEAFVKKVPAAMRPLLSVKLAEYALRFAHDDDKYVVFVALSKSADSKTRGLLRKVARGEIGWLRSSKKPWHDEPSPSACAYLWLAKHGEKGIKADIERQLGGATNNRDLAALEVGLALLGDPKYLRRKHFKIMSYSIGHAGLVAIERFKGVHGMDVLAKTMTDHPWGDVRAEAVIVAQRMVGVTWYHGKADERADWYLDNVKQWWRKHGKEFVRKRRKETAK